ncbi:MAG: hypothetical protein HOO06_11830 [Bdellovibrionaceae bacterium]|jgi:hypothetical protein|nr:hypothetical protein [Pseudobdellovibrionaceae bacterium]
MNKIIKKLSLALLLSTLHLSFAQAKTNGVVIEPASMEVRVASDGRSIDVSLINNEDFDLFCSQIAVESEMIKAPYGEWKGWKKTPIFNTYIRSNESAEISVGHAHIKTKESLEGDKFVYSFAKINSNHVHCQKASFENYCDFASLDEEEEYTIDKILQETNSTSCAKAEGKLHGNVRLRALGLKSVKPISFFPRVLSLDLQNNKITSVKDLSIIENLRTINLNNNPIELFSDFWKMENLRRLYLFGSSIKDIEGIEKLHSLKKLNVGNTDVEDFSPMKKHPRLNVRYKKILKYEEPHAW